MAPLNRVRAVWSGFPGGPGVSTFYTVDPLIFLPAIRALYQAFVNNLPADVNVSFDSTGDVIESTSGLITGSWTAPAVAAIQGMSSGTYSAPTGFQIAWATSAITSGRRIRGRTFFVPAGGAIFTNGGQVAAATRATMDAAILTFLASVTTNMVIYQRERKATNAWTDVRGKVHPAVALRIGGAGVVNAGHVAPAAVVLTSRRD